MKKQNKNEQLIQAAKDGDYIGCIDLIIDQGADLNYREGLAFRYAAKHGHEFIVSYFLDIVPNLARYCPQATLLASNAEHKGVVEVLQKSFDKYTRFNRLYHDRARIKNQSKNR